MYSSFENIENDKPVKNKEYDYRLYEDDKFYYFHHSNIRMLKPEERKEMEVKLNTGWKAHISVEPSKLLSACQIILPIMEQFKVPLFKMVKKDQLEKYRQMAIRKIEDLKETIDKINPKKRKFDDEYFFSTEKKGAQKKLSKAKIELKSIVRMLEGLQLTIYILTGEESRLQTILDIIEHTLDDKKMPLGKIHFSDRALGKYVSVRYAGTTCYQHCLLTNPSNLEKAPDDPFKDIIAAKEIPCSSFDV